MLKSTISFNVLRSTFLLFVFPLAILSCSKDSDEPDTPRKIRSQFYTTKYCNSLLMNDSTQFLDSAVHFINQSDSGLAVKYKWDFGDNQFSEEKDPVHVFNKPGFYTVTLYTFNNNLPSDTFSRNVRIVIWQKEFKSITGNKRVIDLAEADNGETLILLTDDNITSILSYDLIMLDSLLRQKWTKTIPGNSIRLNSLKRIKSNEYILSGNYESGNTSQFSLSKIDATGNLIWQKYIAGLSGKNHFTLPASDGSLITIGDSEPVSNNYTIIVKCDSNGNEIWRKSFDASHSSNRIRNANNIIETVSGYVFAAVEPVSGSSHIVLTKLDFDGNITGQSTIAPGNIGTIFQAGVANLNNRFLVFATNTRYIFMFDESLTFIEQRRVGETNINHAIAADGYFYLAEGDFQYAHVIKLNAEGMQIWSGGISNARPLSCSVVWDGATRYCKKVIYTSTNEIIALSEGDNGKNGLFNWSVFIEKFHRNGIRK